MRTGTVAALMVLFICAGSTIAWASTSRVESEPNGDLSLLVSVGCGDRDKDGDFSTCTNGDTASLLHSVANRTDADQTVRIEAVFDAPGTELDRSSTQDVLVPARDLVNLFDQHKLKSSAPLGEYTLTVTATGTETARTSAAFTVHRKNGR
jgi:hypothetical protein